MMATQSGDKVTLTPATWLALVGLLVVCLGLWKNYTDGATAAAVENSKQMILLQMGQERIEKKLAEVVEPTIQENDKRIRALERAVQSHKTN